MLVDELFDDKFGCFILAGIDTPYTAVILAAHVELIGVSFDYFRWEAFFNGVGSAGVF